MLAAICLTMNFLFYSRYDGYSNENEPQNMKKRKHIRSASCDVKIGRSNSREYDAEYRSRRLLQNRSHSRTNSRDLDTDGRSRRNQTHSRTNSRGEPINIKYILNCLKPDAATNQILMSSAHMMAQKAVAEHGAARIVRKHYRNHSYDQIYNMPNNIKIDQELHNKLNRNRSLAAASTSVIQNDLGGASSSSNASNLAAEGPININSNTSHSRNNSKDLNKSGFISSLVDDAASNILRHRRTNSKDFNRVVSGGGQATTSMTPPSGAVAEATLPPINPKAYHRRNVSLPIDTDHTNVRLLETNESNERSDTNRYGSNES